MAKKSKGKKIDFNIAFFNRKAETQYNYMKQIPVYSKKQQYTQLIHIYGLEYCFQIINENTQQLPSVQMRKKQPSEIHINK